MTRWEEKKVRPVLPLYLAALAWPIGALLLPIYSLPGFVGTAVLSAVAFGAGRVLCPTRVIRKQVAYTTGREEVDKMLADINTKLDALHGLNGLIPDETLTEQLNRMEKAGRSIAAEIEKSPAKADQVSRFARYYLPEVVKIMTAYAAMERGGVKGENANQILTEVRANTATMATAFENQLDALYSAEAMDISTDIAVLDGILKAQNLAK